MKLAGSLVFAVLFALSSAAPVSADDYADAIADAEYHKIQARLDQQRYRAYRDELRRADREQGLFSGWYRDVLQDKVERASANMAAHESWYAGSEKAEISHLQRLNQVQQDNLRITENLLQRNIREAPLGWHWGNRELERRHSDSAHQVAQNSAQIHQLRNPPPTTVTYAPPAPEPKIYDIPVSRLAPKKAQK
jgi:hypothetical protein